MLCISYLDRVTNQKLSEELIREGNFFSPNHSIRRFRMHFAGGSCRREAFKRAKINDIRSYLDRIKKVMRMKPTMAVFSCARDCRRWRNMISQACVTHITYARQVVTMEMKNSLVTSHNWKGKFYFSYPVGLLRIAGINELFYLVEKTFIDGAKF